MDHGLANKIIDTLSDLTEYSISIIDENGKVVASKLKDHIGAFHETAFGIMKGNKDIITVDMANPETGVKEGVYMALYVNKCKTGVLGVYGDPKEILSITGIIKLSIEVMLDYELYKINNMRKYTVKERFMRTLFYSNDFSRSDLEQYFKDMDLDEHAVRIPVLIEFNQASLHSSSMAKQISEGSHAAKQDLIGITNEGYLFLLKSISQDIKTVMQDYKFLLGEYLSPLLQYVRSNHLEYSIYVGPIQNDIMQYRQAFLYCKWMQNHINKKGSYYFYDFIVKYLESKASQNEYNAMFLYLEQELDSKFIDNYVEIMSALIEKDYSLAKASNILHIHKNTLAYRLGKIREVLSMNPLASNSEREFMECFYFYLKRKSTKGGE